jgi:hypothetical protein
MANIHQKIDIQNIFGENVDVWADLNGKKDPTHIAARVLWASNLAHSKLEGRLRGGPYELPLAGTDLQIIDLEARWAGVLLYEGRKITDNEDATHSPAVHKKRVREEIKGILAGTIRLSGETETTASYPQNIK